ncbi:hypothetical protein F4820DRAFT_162115 [Hypoxylon rubiginosum]|uniref:Uncharacterized protein n=1 Tax=Hypoxylon rubiginosum TaxID=110542 RepID=A0ACB9Z8J8_9PEZI|nr:hypothetical protein F4820DRAFT_162115 [Hypoxylon rubiginosum]
MLPQLQQGSLSMLVLLSRGTVTAVRGNNYAVILLVSILYVGPCCCPMPCFGSGAVTAVGSAGEGYHVRSIDLRRRSSSSPSRTIYYGADHQEKIGRPG